MTESKPDALFKVILAGDTNTGKTNIANIVKGADFNPDLQPTSGVEFTAKIFTIDGSIV